MSNQPWEEPEEQEEPEETDYPIVLMRSKPIRIRFAHQTCKDDASWVRLTSFFGDRHLATTMATRDELRAIRDSNAWSSPVPILGIARYASDSDTLLLMVKAEACERIGPFDAEEVELRLGLRFRAAHRQRFPGDLEREARDFFWAVLQGRPQAAITRLFDEARREANRRHEARLRSGGHPPARDIAEGFRRSRIQRGDER